ncbi:MAG: DUF2141 domain-containing protein, partial [Planctomycetes bacterium]|nr:DUF2141 domain-containing protein [Planctomycetota bacterium]
LQTEPLVFLSSPQDDLTVTVRVTHPGSLGGTVEVSLFDSPDSFMKKPYLQFSGPVAQDGTFTATFAAVPEGAYAVVVVHDENGNGTLDRGFLGFGGESYAFSNGASPWFGWPDFEDAAFRVDGPVELDIRLE